jgi:hypothetical protein
LPIQGEGTLEFRLLYQGLLRSNGNVEDKFLIRRQFHSQLRRLWSEHPVLRETVKRVGMVSSQHDEKYWERGIEAIAGNNRISDFRFLPLAHKRFFLRCSLDVLFMRREKAGTVFMRGDIDNRLKTLFDALKMPFPPQECGTEKPLEEEDPFYVLLEDDEIIADVSVTTDRLLQVPDEQKHARDYAVLVINVKLQPTQRAEWWHVFS